MGVPNNIVTWPLACPVCNNGLRRESNSLVCPERHTFDIARQGYVNLLVAQHRTRGIDGDTAEMLQARRRFLAGGHYEPLLDMLKSLTRQVLANAQVEASGQHQCVLEVGCGEGYYVGNIAHGLHDKHAETAFVGMDVSKAASSYAARRYENVLFFVGDVHRRIYVQNRSVTVLLNVFSPRNQTEFARIVQPGGHILTVIPAESHLASLRSRLSLLDIEEDKEERVLDRLTGYFRMVDRHVLSYPLVLAPDAVSDLVKMGPNFWHQTDDPMKVITEPVETEASFIVLQLERFEITI